MRVTDSVSDDALSDSEHCERKVCLDDGKNEVVEGYQRALPAEIQELFPTQYEYIVESYTKHQLESFLGAEMHNFTLRVWTNCPSQSVAIKWIEEFQKISKTAYRVTRGSQTSGRRTIFKTIRHCQHQQKQMTPLQLSNQQQLKKKKLGREKSTRDKKTMCPSTLVARIYQPGSSQTSSHPKHPCLIDIHYNHNHPINSGHALSFRPVSDDVKQEYIHLFEAGHSSATARHEYTSQLQLKHDTQSIEQVLADRAANPNCQDIQRLFREWRDKYIGPENGEVMFDQLSQEVRQYTEAHAGEGGRVFLQKYETGLSSDTLDNQYSQPTKSKMKKVTDNVPFILAIVTPLMARAHQMLRQSGELVYCDSTASLNNLNTAVFILSSSTSAGAVPLGAVMTSSEDADTLTAAFMALRDILPDQAFFARGQRLGPLTFLTDDCSSERKALKATWPQAQLHLCVFHFLQSMWRWLWNAKSGVTESDDRISCMLLTKRLVYAHSEQALKDIKSEIDRSKFQQYRERIAEYWRRKGEWALCLRRDFPTGGNYTNNYAEATIRITKDILFQRRKAWNVIQMFRMVTTTLELYYQRRIMSVASNRLDHFVSLKFTIAGIKADAITLDDITPTDDPDVYTVVSKSSPDTLWTVDLKLGECTCPIGYNGQPCKHQLSAAVKYRRDTVNHIPSCSPQGRQFFAALALGNHCQEISFYSSLHHKADEEYLNSLSVEMRWSDEDIKGCLADTVPIAEKVQEGIKQNDDCPQAMITEEPERLGKVTAEYREVTNDIERGLSQSKTGESGFVAAVEKFCSNYWRLRGQQVRPPSTQQRLLCALHTFGGQCRNNKTQT